MKEPDLPQEKRRSRARTPAAAVVKLESAAEKPKSAPSRNRKSSLDPVEDLTAVLSQKVVGQPAATRVIEG